MTSLGKSIQALEGGKYPFLTATSVGQRQRTLSHCGFISGTNLYDNKETGCNGN